MARLSFRCSEELVAAVDRERGRVARERWLRDAVEAAVHLGDDVAEWQAGASERASASEGSSRSPEPPVPAEQPEMRGLRNVAEGFVSPRAAPRRDVPSFQRGGS